MCQSAKDARAVGFNAEFDEDVGARITSCCAQQRGARCRNELAKNAASGTRREKVRARRIANARSVPPIVADGWMIQGKFHELGEAHPASRVGPGSEFGLEFGRHENG